MQRLEDEREEDGAPGGEHDRLVHVGDGRPLRDERAQHEAPGLHREARAQQAEAQASEHAGGKGQRGDEGEEGDHVQHPGRAEGLHAVVADLAAQPNRSALVHGLKRAEARPQLAGRHLRRARVRGAIGGQERGQALLRLSRRSTQLAQRQPRPVRAARRDLRGVAGGDRREKREVAVQAHRPLLRAGQRGPRLLGGSGLLRRGQEPLVGDELVEGEALAVPGQAGLGAHLGVGHAHDALPAPGLGGGPHRHHPLHGVEPLHEMQRFQQFTKVRHILFLLLSSGHHRLSSGECHGR